MKKRILIMMLVLGVLAGVVFVDTTPRVPVVAEIVGASPGYGGLNIICLVTNTTAQPYVLLANVEGFSNGNWESQPVLVNGGRGLVLIAPYASTQVQRWTHQTSGVLRVSIHYGKDKTTRQHQIDSWLRKLHVGPVFNDRLGGYITTSPTNFPTR